MSSVIHDIDVAEAFREGCWLVKFSNPKRCDRILSAWPSCSTYPIWLDLSSHSEAQCRITLKASLMGTTIMSPGPYDFNFCFPVRDLESDRVKLTPFIVSTLCVPKRGVTGKPTDTAIETCRGVYSVGASVLPAPSIRAIRIRGRLHGEPLRRPHPS